MWIDFRRSMDWFLKLRLISKTTVIINENVDQKKTIIHLVLLPGCLDKPI